MRFIWGFLITLMFSVSGTASYTLAVFGDSLSNGHRLPKQDSFYAQLEQALTDKGYDIQVLNASKSGETTTGGIRKVANLLSQKPDGVILELGVNDSFRNTPIKNIRQNLKKLIETFQNQNIPVLLVGMKTMPNKPADYQQQFEALYQDLAQEYDLELYPFFMDGIFESTQVWNFKIQNDNLIPNDIHPNAQGVALMVRGILPTVEHFLERQNIFPKGY